MHLLKVLSQVILPSKPIICFSFLASIDSTDELSNVGVNTLMPVEVIHAGVRFLAVFCIASVSVLSGWMCMLALLWYGKVGKERIGLYTYGIFAGDVGLVEVVMPTCGVAGVIHVGSEMSSVLLVHRLGEYSGNGIGLPTVEDPWCLHRIVPCSVEYVRRWVQGHHKEIESRYRSESRIHH